MVRTHERLTACFRLMDRGPNDVDRALVKILEFVRRFERPSLSTHQPPLAVFEEVHCTSDLNQPSLIGVPRVVKAKNRHRAMLPRTHGSDRSPDRCEAVSKRRTWQLPVRSSATHGA